MNEKLRIAVVSPLFPLPEEPYRGSPIYQTVLALQRLADVEVFCPLSNFPRWKWFQPRRFRFRRADPGYSPPGVRATYIDYPAFPLLSRAVNGSVCARRLLPYLQAARPNVILAYWIYPEGYAAVAAGQKLGVPVIVGARGFDLTLIRDPFTYFWTRLTVRRAAYVLTVSEEMRHLAVKLGATPENVRTIPNGCDSSVFRLQDRSEARRELGVQPDVQAVLYVGRLEPLKGISELLEACARLVPSLPRLRLFCIGETPREGNPFQIRASQPDLQGRVTFLGPQPAERVARWLSAADLLCLPSYSEGCPNVVLEALSCGRAVVASHVGGIPDIVDSTCGILIPPRSVSQLAEALAGALERRWDEASIAAHFGRSWQDVAEETYQACQATAARHP